MRKFFLTLVACIMAIAANAADASPDGTTVWLSVSQSTPWAWSTGSTNANRNIRLTYDAASGTFTGGTLLACHNSVMEPGILENGREGFRLGRAFKCYVGTEANTETTKPTKYLEIGNNEYGGVAPVFTSMTEVLDYTYTEGTTEGGMAWQFGNNSDGSASFPAGSKAAEDKYAMVYVQIDLNNKTAKLSLTPFVGGTVDPEPEPEPEPDTTVWLSVSQSTPWAWSTGSTNANRNIKLTYDAASGTYTGGTYLACHNSIMEPGILEDGRTGFRLGRAFKCYLGDQSNTETTKPKTYLEIGNNEYGGVAPVFTSMTEVLDYTYTEGTTEGGMAWQFGNNSDGSASFPAGSAAAANQYAMVYVQIDLKNQTAKLSLTPFASGTVDPEPDPEPQGNSVTFNFTGVEDAYKYVTAFNLQDDDNPTVTFDAATSTFNYPEGGTGLVFSASNGYEIEITCPEASQPGTNYLISQDMGYMLQLWAGANGYTFTVNVTDPTPAAPEYLQMAMGTSMAASSVSANPATDLKIEKVSDGVYGIKNLKLDKSKAFWFYTDAGPSRVKYTSNTSYGYIRFNYQYKSSYNWPDASVDPNSVNYANIIENGNGGWFLSSFPEGLDDALLDLTVDLNEMKLSITAVDPNPQPAMDLYLVGANINGNADQWSSKDYAFEKQSDGTYKWSGTSLGNEFKINGGDWTTYNIGAPEGGNNVLTLGQQFTVANNSNSQNIMLGLYPTILNPVVVLDYDAMTLTVTGTYGYPETMYILGNVDGSKFVPESATSMEPLGEKAGVYSLEVSITSDPDDPQYGYVQFATQKAPANSQDPWNQMGIRLGAAEKDLLVTVDSDTKSVTYPLTTNDFSFKVTPGDYNVEVNYTNAVPQVTFTEAEKPADGKSIYLGVTSNGTWPNTYNTNYVLAAVGDNQGNNTYLQYEGTVTLPVGSSFNMWFPANINADGIVNFMPIGPSDETEGKVLKFSANEMTYSERALPTTDGFWTLGNDQEIELKISYDYQTWEATFECLTQLGGNTDPEPEPEPGPGGLKMYVVTQAQVPAGNFANEVSADNVQLSYNASNGTYEGGVMIANKNGTPYNRSFRVYTTTEAGTAQTYYTGSKASEYGNEQFTFPSESDVLSSTMKTTTEKTGYAWSIQANTGWPAGTQAATDGYAMLYMQIDVTNMTAKFSMSPFESEEPEPEPDVLKMYVVTQAQVPAGNFDNEVSAENVELTYNASNETYEGGVMIANKNGTPYNRSFRVYTTDVAGKAQTYYTGSKASEYGNEQFTFTSESDVISSTMKTTTEKTGYAWSVQANTGWPAGTQAATDGYAMLYMQIDVTNMTAKFSMSPFSSEEPEPQLPENIDVTYNFENLEDIMSYNSAITNSSAWPADGTTANKAFDFGQTFELKSEGITLTTEKNNGTSPRAYMTSAGAYTFRVYSGNYFTVSAPEGYQVDEVIIKVGSTTNTNLAKTATLDPAKYGEFTAVNKVGTWTSPAGKSFNSVPFVVNSTNLFITSIEVKASKASGEIEPEPEPQGNSVTFNFTGVADAYKYVTAYSLTDDDNPQVTFNAATSKFEYPKGGTGLIFSASNGYELSITCPEASVPGQNYMISQDAGYMLQLFDGANGYTFTVNVTDPTPEPTYLYVVGQDFGGGTPTNAVALVPENGYYTYTTANWSKISTVKADWNSGFDANALNAQGTAQAVQEQTLKLVKGTANMPLPYAATFTYKIKEDLSEVTVIGDVPPASKYTELYVRGSMNSWGTDNNWKLETEDGVLYVLKNVNIPSGATFKIGSSNWNPGYGVNATIDADKLYTLNTNPTGNDIKMGAAVNGATVSFSTETLAFLVSTDGKTVADFGNVPNYSAWYVNVMGTFEGGGDSMTSPYGQPDTDGIAVIDNVAIGTNTFEIKTWDGSVDAYYSYGDKSVPVGEWVQLADAQGVRSTVEGATADAVYQVKFDVTNNQVFLTKTAGSDPEPEPEVLKMYVVTNATVPAGNFNENVSADNVELTYNAENGTYEGGIVIANKNGTDYGRSFRVYTTDVAGQAQTYYTGSKATEYGNEQFIFSSEADVVSSTMKTTTESTGYAWSVNINGGWPAGSDAAEWGYGALYMQIDVKNMTAKFSMTPFNGEVIPVEPPVPPVAEGELVLNPGTDFTLQSGEINNEAKTIVMESLQETVTIYIEAPVNATVYYQITDVAPNEPATVALPGYTVAKQLVDGPFTVELKNATTGKLNLYFELDGLQSEVVTYTYTCNYATPSGIFGIYVDEDAEYYTLDGVKVQNPVKGIYIKVKDGKTTKVVIR